MPTRARLDASARAAIVVGAVVSFVAAVDLARWMRPAVLADPDPAWSIPRLFLGLLLVAGAACAGGISAAVFLVAARRLPADLALVSVPLPKSILAALAAAAVLLGAAARFLALETLPASLWIDDVSLIAPTLALTGSPSDFSEAVRPAPYGTPKTYGSVGVLYLELYRAALRIFGATVFGVRFLSAAAGVASLLTALLVARFLLPRGGGTLAALILAGLRWHLILSRWGWNAIVLAPIIDIAVLLLLASRRRGSLALALSSGVVAGLASHVYLAAWVAGAGLALLAAWPSEPNAPVGRRARRAFVFAAGFAVVAAPLFFLREGRTATYFARASDHSLATEIRYTRSVMPAFAAAADSLAGPWLVPDPVPRNDLPGRKRLPWVLGVVLAVALGRALLRPREEISAYLLSQAGAAFAGTVAGGQADVPNGYRFGYLSDATAVAAAAGVLAVLALFPAPRRRAAALVMVGLIAVSGALGARDALVVWPERRETFDGFHGQDTLLARTAMRWERYGPVEISRELGHSPVTIGGILRYRLDPELPGRALAAGAARTRRFRVIPPKEAALPGERVVERVQDDWGRPWAVVVGSPGPG